MSRHKLSEAQEDYLKQILRLTEFDEPVSTQALAHKLDVKPASVTGMVKKLAELSLVDYRPYRGIELTEAGRKIALEVQRHHRLLELYLADMLNYTWDEIHDEAERLEHVISEKFEARIAEKLGDPTHDPHGDPIPTESLEYPEALPLVMLSAMKENDQGEIKRVKTQDRDALNMLDRLNLRIDVPVKVLCKDSGGIRVEVQGDRLLLPHSLAHQLLVLKEHE